MTRPMITVVTLALLLAACGTQGADGKLAELEAEVVSLETSYGELYGAQEEFIAELEAGIDNLQAGHTIKDDQIARLLVDNAVLVTDLNAVTESHNLLLTLTTTQNVILPVPEILATNDDGLGTQFSDGLWVLNEEIARGTYKNMGGEFIVHDNGELEFECSWAIFVRWTTSYRDDRAADYGEQFNLVRLTFGDLMFRSTGCGTWTRVDGMP